MPRYGDDQCEECGAPRVAGSNLCPQCIVRERDILEKEVLIKMAVIEVQRKRIANLERLLKEAMVYGFKKNQENARLHQHLLQRAQSIEKERKDGKDGQGEDKEE